MLKTAFLFAGQGAQTVGMGRELAEAYPVARKLFERANEVLGYDLTRICFEGPESELLKTENTQPGIYLVSWVAMAVLRERVPGLEFAATAGLSLGEVTALAAADAFTFEEGLELVRQRGRFMHEACEVTQGGMAAIIGLEEGPTREVCEATGVTLANLNCPGQLVISGEASRIASAVELARQRGAKKAISLAVAGAYHSPLMASAQPKLRGALSRMTLRRPKVPVYSNVTALPHGDVPEMVERLVEQVTGSVRWEESVRNMSAAGCVQMIELGPGAALSSFVRRIDKGVKILNVADVKSLEATVAALNASASA